MDRRDFSKLAASIPLLASTCTRAEVAAQPSLSLPGKGLVYDIGHGEARILVGSQQSGGQWWLGSIRSDPHRKTSLHVHFKADEYVYVLEGTLSVWLEGKWNDLPTDAVATLPRGTHHALGNRSARSMRYLASGNPAGFERFFAEIEAATRHSPYGSPEFLDALARIYTHYDSKLLGPPPAG